MRENVKYKNLVSIFTILSLLSGDECLISELVKNFHIKKVNI